MAEIVKDFQDSSFAQGKGNRCFVTFDLNSVVKELRRSAEHIEAQIKLGFDKGLNSEIKGIKEAAEFVDSVVIICP
jgi:hypothetical protein